MNAYHEQTHRAKYSKPIKNAYERPHPFIFHIMRRNDLFTPICKFTILPLIIGQIYDIIFFQFFIYFIIFPKFQYFSISGNFKKYL